jgi:uncharacterized BrkB/YihY/UPF0761 family membrane protein
MKRFLIAISIPIAILLIAYLMIMLIVGNSELDIHLHDAYIIIDRRTSIIYSMLIILFLVSLVSAVYNRFRKTLFNWLLVGSSLAILIAMIYTWVLLNPN